MNIQTITRVLLTSIMLAGAATGGGDLVVDQKDRKFSRTEVTVHPGESITFANSDDVAHNVFSVTPGLEFEIHRQAPGEKSSITFAKEGVVEVRCSIHPRMKMLVTVKK
jgi:plastocyanin